MQSEGVREREVTKRFLASLALVFSLVFLAAAALILLPKMAYAGDDVTLTITGDGVSNPTTWTKADLQAMAQYKETYSVINTWPTKIVCVGQGVKLRDLLNLAGIKENAQSIKFISSDDFAKTMTVEELLKIERYYFPQLMKYDPNSGSSSSYSLGKRLVEPMISLLNNAEDDDESLMDAKNTPSLMFGQRVINEQFKDFFVRNITTIEVQAKAPQKCNAPTAIPESGNVEAGTLIELKVSKTSLDSDKIYYTLDGSEPTIDSQVFNWYSQRWANDEDRKNPPIRIDKDTVLKAITIGPGRLESDVAVFDYKIGQPDPALNGPPSEVVLDKTNLLMNIGDTDWLSAAIKPNNGTEYPVNWHSSKENVVTVDTDGLVTAAGLGTAIITVTVETDAGNLTATAAVKVTKDEIPEQGMGSGTESGLQNGGGYGLPAGQPNTAETNGLNNAESQVDFGQDVSTHGESGQGREEVNLDHSDSDDESEAAASVDIEEEPPENGEYLISVDEFAADQTAAPYTEFDGQVWQMYELMPEGLEQTNIKLYSGIVLGMLFFSGAGRRYRKYFKEGAS